MGKKIAFKNGEPKAGTRCPKCGKIVTSLAEHNCEKKD